jgi:hypothetical protein
MEGTNPPLHSQNMSDYNTREHDLEELRRAWREAKDPSERDQIKRAGERISKESGEVRSMREALIREHRKGNKANIQDIHDIVEHERKYRE